MKLGSKTKTLIQNPSIIKLILQGKSLPEIRATIREKKHSEQNAFYRNEIAEFLANQKQNSRYSVDPAQRIKLCKLCNIEDWNNNELIETIKEVYVGKPPSHIMRKDWEWALGVISMKRYGKLNKDCIALGVGSGKELVLFYLANQLKHVYATDLYEGKDWREAPADFPTNPAKYAPFRYNNDALTVMRMDGRKLDFPSNSFDIVFSFSSIEHFGDDHIGPLKSLKEVERVLKPGGIAVIATENIINDKDYLGFFNYRTIYSDLIDRLEMKLVEPLDTGITASTLDTVMDFFDAVKWGDKSEEFRKSHPHVLLSIKNILYTSVMLVFQKAEI